MNVQEILKEMRSHNWSTDDFKLAFQASGAILDLQDQLKIKAIANEDLRARIAVLEAAAKGKK